MAFQLDTRRLEASILSRGKLPNKDFKAPGELTLKRYSRAAVFPNLPEKKRKALFQKEP